MTDNARELSMGEMRDICEYDSIRLRTTVPYPPAAGERMIRGLANVVRPMLPTRACRAEAFSTAMYVRNRMPTKALEMYPLRDDVQREVGSCGFACVRSADGVNAVGGLRVGLQASEEQLRYGRVR